MQNVTQDTFNIQVISCTLHVTANKKVVGVRKEMTQFIAA